MSRTVRIVSSKFTKTYSIPKVESWARVARDIMKHLTPGSIVALSGPLGAGKTTFVQALAREFGIQRLPQSPTFALMRTYPIPARTRHAVSLRRLIHVDAYRIEQEADFLVLDLDEELADGGSVLVIEWPEHVPGWLKKRPAVIWINIDLS